MTKWEILKEYIRGLEHPLKVHVFHACRYGEFRVQDGSIVFEYNWNHLYEEDKILGVTEFDENGFELTVFEKEDVMFKEFKKKEAWVPSGIYLTIEDYYTMNDREGDLRARSAYKELYEKFKLAKEENLIRNLLISKNVDDILIGTKIRKLY